MSSWQFYPCPVLTPNECNLLGAENTCVALSTPASTQSIPPQLSSPAFQSAGRCARLKTRWRVRRPESRRPLASLRLPSSIRSSFYILALCCPSRFRRSSSPESGGVISEFLMSYISWDLITGVIRLITFRADIISARTLGPPESGRESSFQIPLMCTEAR